jgi:phospholipid N-methyltransferase
MESTEITQGLPFVREAVRDFRTTGAVAPSSRQLATRLAAPFARSRAAHPATVLEVGAGTGSVTRALARLLRPADRLDVVEVNPRFVGVLRQALLLDPVLAGVGDQVRVVPGSITEVRLDCRYDAIVSCLPFANFDPAEVRTILDRYVASLLPGGHLTYFGYLGTRVADTVLGNPTAVRHRQVRAVLAEFDQRYGVGHSHVWVNLPPARVRHLQVPR